jgi:hypothetical protein
LTIGTFALFKPFLCPVASPNLFDLRRQRHGAKGFGHHLHGTQSLVTSNFIGVGIGSEKYHGNGRCCGVLAQFGKGGRAVHTGHDHIEQNQIRRESLDLFNRLGTRATDKQLETPTFSSANLAMA